MDNERTPGALGSNAELGLVERLRRWLEGDATYNSGVLIAAAADEIDLLRAEVAVLRMACERWEQALKRSDEARREAVSAEREQCMGKMDSHGRYWVENRSRIIDAVTAAGFQIMSNCDRCWLAPLGPNA